MAEQTSQQSSRTFDVFGRKVDTDKLVLLLSDRDAFDSYYRNKKISDSEREDTWRSLNILRKHLADGTGGLQVVIDDNGYEGINNTAGMHNLDKKGRVKKGADAYATSYFLRLAKGMDAYEEPKKETDKSKIKYSDLAIGTALNRYFYGRDNGDIQDFLDLDKYDETKKIRPNTNRAALFRKGLEHVKTNWDNLFEGWTGGLKTQALKNIEDAFTVFDNDHVITDNEYLTLGKATGMTNLRKMFANEEVAVTQQDESSVDLSAPKQRTYGDKIRWIERTYKPYTGRLRNPLSIAVPSTEVYGDATKNIVTNGFQNASNDELYSLIREGLDGADLNNSTLMKKLFPKTNPRMSSYYLTNAALQLLKYRTDGLYNFGESNFGMYYIPTTRTANNTGIVWNSNDNTLNEMSIHDIPYWTKRINDEWDALGNDYDDYDLNPILTARYKSGGVLKASRGNVLNVMDRLGVPGENNWLNINNTYANAQDTDTWVRYYNNTRIDNDIKNSLLGSITGPWTHGYLKDKDGNIVKGDDGQTKYGLTGVLLGILLNKLEQQGANLSWNKKLNATGYDQWNRTFDQTGFNEYFGGDSDRFDYMGPSTYNRHAFLERMKSVYNKENPLTIGGDKIYWDGRKWALGTDPIKPEIPGTRAEITPPDEILSPQLSTTTEVVENDSRLGGMDPKDKGNNTDTWNRVGQMALDLTPDLIGAGRLLASLHTNNRVARTILPSLNPVLKDTYERYSPITGAFSERLLRNMQGAETLSQSSRPFTSDASLAAARMLEGLRHANNLQYQGFVADDREIQRTKEAALARQEDNMARRSDVANFNRASINLTNRERAQLEATRLKSNWQSWDNFLSGIEQRMRTRFDENRENRNAFELAIASDNATTDYTNAQREVQDAYNAWLTRTDENGRQPNKGKLISEWDDYDKAQRYLQDIQQRGNARQRVTLARIYGGRYTDPYNGEYYLNFSRYTKNGGKLIPKKRK